MDIMETFFQMSAGWFFAFWNSTFLFVMKIIAAIYVTVMIVGMILILHMEGLNSRLKSLKYGSSDVGASHKGNGKRWKKIDKRMQSDDEEQWKLAILEADQLVDDVLVRQGYEGDNFMERFAGIPDGLYDAKPPAYNAHLLRNSIVRDEDMSITREEADGAMDAFYDFLGSLGSVNWNKERKSSL